MPVNINMCVWDTLSVKEALCRFLKEMKKQNVHIYSINEVIMQINKYLFCPLMNKRAVLRGK